MSSYKFDGNKTLNVKCPNCGRTIAKSLKELRTDKPFQCPGCELVFQPDGVDDSFKEAEQALDRFRRDMRRMFK